MIPDKNAFRIGEVASIAGVTPSVLRFWESEFAGLRPAKTKSGQRLYRRSDVEKVMRIRDLLYDRGYTIAGAKRALRGDDPGPSDTSVLRAIRREAEDLLRVLGE
jgi:DNA-binding transcriptional MerR regulator